MKKFFSFFAALLFAGSMMAADVVKATLDFTSNTVWQLPVGSGEGITTDSAYSDGTYTIRLAATTKYYFHTDGYLLFGKSGSTLTLPAFDFDVTKIVVTGRAGASGSTKQNIFVGENAVSTETTGAQVANEYAIASDYQAAGNVYVLKVTSNHNTQVTKIEIYGEGEAPAVATPVIAGDAEFTESTQVSISCTTEGAAIYYTVDGADPTSNSLPYSEPFTLNASATVKAVAYDNENNQSAIASKTFTKKEPLVAISCAEVYNKAKGDELALNNVVVTYANGKNVYVQDETGSMLLYLTQNTTWEAGNILSGVEGTLDIYNSLYEVKMTEAQATAVQPGQGEVPAPVEFTAAPVAADMNKYIVLKNVTVSAETFPSNKNMNATIGDETFVLRNNFNADVAFDTNKAYDITGVVAVYNSTVQVYFINATEAAAPALEAIVYNWAVDAASGHVGTTILGGNSNITTGTIKIHENKDDVNGIKFGSSYVYAEGKYVAIKPVEGGFKAGDEIRMSVVFNNSDVTKYCMADVYAADHATRLFRSDSASTLNGQKAGEPIVQTYTLASDQDSLFFGRYGNTGMFITFLQVARSEEVVPPTPQPTVNYYVAGSMNGWAANEAYMLAPDNAGLFKGEFTFAANAEFKVIGFDGENTTWFPEGMGNNYVITEAGDYKITFDPAGNVEGWYEGFFNVVKKEEPVALTVAQAIEIGMALDSMATSEAEYVVEGYVINAGAFSQLYHNQSWYMVDDAAATESSFQAYNCYPIEGNDTLKVLNGDKVSVVGKLKKYYNKSAQVYIIEIEKGDAHFISKVDGDHSTAVETETITIAQALEIGAALADNAVTEKQYKITGYVSAINVQSKDAYSDQYKNQSFWVADDANSTASTNADGAFYVYRGKPNTEAEIPVGSKVEFTCTIKKYVPAGGDAVIENADQNIVVKVLEAGEVDTLNVQGAVELALSLEDNTETAKAYAILGYVAKIKEAYSEQYGNISFFMTDTPSNGEEQFGDLQVYRGKISAEAGAALAAGDRVLVVGKLKNNFYNEKNSAEVVAGSSVSVMWKQAIENIVLTEKVNKVLMDGAIYIVRDGKLYNLQGAQVR